MPTYYLAPALSRLRNDTNSRWPGRDRTSDGWIGDVSHAARRSDHNPDWSAGGVVRAVDLDRDGMDAGWVIACALQDHRTEYVIHAGLIYQRRYGFAPRKYTGPNAHTGHVHVSIRHGRTWENDTSPWLDNAVPVSRPVAGAPVPVIPTPTGALPPALEDNDMTPEDRAVLAAAARDAAAAREHAEQARVHAARAESNSHSAHQIVRQHALATRQHAAAAESNSHSANRIVTELKGTAAQIRDGIAQVLGKLGGA